MLTSLFSLFYVTGEFHRFLHRGRATNLQSPVVLIPCKGVTRELKELIINQIFGISIERYL